MIDYTKTKVDWTVYINRKESIFCLSCFNRPYGKLLFETTGSKFTHQLYKLDKDTVIVYKSKKKLQEVDQYFLRLIKSNDPKLKQWYEIGLQTIKQQEELIALFSKNPGVGYIQSNYPKILEKIEYIFLYLTTIPYRILSAINTAIESGEDIAQFKKTLEHFEYFRKKVSRVTITNVVFTALWKAAAQLKNHDNYIDFSFLTPNELGNLFKNKNYPNQEEINKRKKGCVFYDDNDNMCFNYNSTFLEKIGIHQLDNESISELRGNIACKGFAKGKVMIINDPKDMKGFQRGDVLLSITTSASLMPALEKCAAIVTDEGGIMCHAAVISRELNKPCIIGTKHATKVFKNGDIVEVDANKGIIKKLL